MGTEASPSYTQTGDLKSSEDVPFRFTRNITSCVYPLTQGSFKTAMMVSVGALADRSHALTPFINVLLRDDMVAWKSLKVTTKTDQEHREIEKDTRPQLKANAQLILDRVRGVSPRTGFEVQVVE